MKLKEYLKKLESGKIKVFPPHYLKKFDETRTIDECEERQTQFTLGYIGGLKKGIKLFKNQKEGK